jgi:hypothetical protein
MSEPTYKYYVSFSSVLPKLHSLSYPSATFLPDDLFFCKRSLLQYCTLEVKQQSINWCLLFINYILFMFVGCFFVGYTDVEQELLTLQGHMTLPSVCSGVRVVRSLVF